MRIVLDTNVLISAVLWTGLPHRLLGLAEEGRFTLCFSPALLEELEVTLRRPKFRPLLERRSTSVDEIIIGLFDLGELYEAPAIAPPPGLVDPDDTIPLACAEFAGAEYLVSGDTHLLALHRYQGTQILSVADFLDACFPEMRR